VFPLSTIRSAQNIMRRGSHQNPYMEQQFPFGQCPQTVLPFPTPHVPSVVTGAVATASAGIVVDIAMITGSAVVLDCAPPPLVPSVHPF
jgi:hypothetical protein